MDFRQQPTQFDVNNSYEALNMTQPQPVPPTQPVIVNKQSPVIVQVPGPRKRYENYNSALSKKFGIAQLVLGATACVLNIIGIIISPTRPIYLGIYRSTSYYFVLGIWNMLFVYSLSGSFALCAAARRTKCWIVTTMVFSIIACLFTLGTIGVAGWAIAWATKHGSMAVSVLYLITGIAQFIICVWTSVLCCEAVCSGGRGEHPSKKVCARASWRRAAYAPRIAQPQNANNTQPGQFLVLDQSGQPIPGAQIVQVQGTRG